MVWVCASGCTAGICLVLRILSFRVFERQSSYTVASGTDTRAARKRLHRRRDSSSGHRNSKRTCSGTRARSRLLKIWGGIFASSGNAKPLMGCPWHGSSRNSCDVRPRLDVRGKCALPNRSRIRTRSQLGAGFRYGITHGRHGRFGWSQRPT